MMDKIPEAKQQLIDFLENEGYFVFNQVSPCALTPDRQPTEARSFLFKDSQYQEVLNAIKTKLGDNQGYIGVYQVLPEKVRVSITPLAKPDGIGNIFDLKVEKYTVENTFQPRVKITIDYAYEWPQDSRIMGFNKDELEILDLIDKVIENSKRKPK